MDTFHILIIDGELLILQKRNPETYLEPCQTFMIKLFVKIVNS